MWYSCGATRDVDRGAAAYSMIGARRTDNMPPAEALGSGEYAWTKRAQWSDATSQELLDQATRYWHSDNVSRATANSGKYTTRSMGRFEVMTATEGVQRPPIHRLPSNASVACSPCVLSRFHALTYFDVHVWRQGCVACVEGEGRTCAPPR